MKTINENKALKAYATYCITTPEPMEFEEMFREVPLGYEVTKQHLFAYGLGHEEPLQRMKDIRSLLKPRMDSCYEAGFHNAATLFISFFTKAKNDVYLDVTECEAEECVCDIPEDLTDVVVALEGKMVEMADMSDNFVKAAEKDGIIAANEIKALREKVEWLEAEVKTAESRASVANVIV